MFTRYTASGKWVAVGSGVPPGGVPEPKARKAAKKAEPEPEPESAPEPVAELEPDELEAPKHSDPKSDWVDYAIAKGADPVQAEELTKIALIERYGEG